MSLSGWAPAAGISTIYPDPVVAVIGLMKANAAAAASKGASGMRAGMGRLGCGNGAGQLIPWKDAYGGFQLMGRDVNMQGTALSGLGDFAPASFAVPENPIMRGYQAVTGNAIGRNLAGLNAIDTTSVSGFINSIMSGTGDIVPGVSDLMVVGGALLLLVLASGGAAKGRR
jgi:hypothetical protein